MLESFRKIVVLQHPDHRPAFAILQNSGHDPALRNRIENRDHPVENQRDRTLQHRACERDLLPLGCREPRARDTDLVIQSDRYDQGSQSQVVENLPHQRAHAGDRLRLSGDHFPEQNVVLQRRGDVVPVRVEEFHRPLEVLGKVGGEVASRLHDAFFERLVDQSQAVTGLDQLERQCQQLIAIGLAKPSQVRFHCARQDLLESR